MERRELLKCIAAITGGAVVGAELFLTGCTTTDRERSGAFTQEDILFFDEVAETIIPRTDTPGAKDAAVGQFMARYATDCYDELSLTTLHGGIAKLNESSREKYRAGFLQLNPGQRQELLTDIDAEAKRHNEERDRQPSGNQPPHYFTLMKQLVLFGFFTSKPGMTQVLRYEPVPGKYQGCIDYKQGQTSWA